jgi:DNA polymerase I-like protein with 3'-5' exonuclease and polymerase domains
MLLAIDTETTGIDFFHGCKPFLITACDGKYNYSWSGEVNPNNREVYWNEDEIDSFISLVRSASRIIMHNANFDIRSLASIGIDPNLFWDKLEDTLLASHAICSGDVHGLKDLAIKYLDYWDDDEQELAATVKERVREARKQGLATAKAGHPHFPGLRKNGTEFWKMDYWLAPDACLQYAYRDAERTWLLWDAFKVSLIQDNLLEPYRTRKKLLRIAYNMQTTGKNFYAEQARTLISTLTQEIEEHRQAMKRTAGITYRFDPNNRTHLIDLIHNRLKIPVKYYTGNKKNKTASTPKPAMDKKSLAAYMEEFQAPALTELSNYRKKLKHRTDIEGYLNWIDENNRTHSFLNITGTRETRQSSSNPNDQNIDKLLKTLFGPPPGKVWICTDMVNIELRIWAYSTGNRELIQAFEQGKSVHALIMELIFPEEYKVYISAKKKARNQLTELDQKSLKQYGYVKNGNFARIYGATDTKTNETYHNGKNAPNYCAKIDARFPGIKQFMESRVALAKATQHKQSVFGIYTLGGYRLDVPIDEPFKACNFYVQGSAGWFMTEAMIAWDAHPEYSKHNCQMISQVHDGLDTEAPIVSSLPRIIDAKCLSIVNACKKFIPTCEVTWELLYHPSDETNTIIQEIIAK